MIQKLYLLGEGTIASGRWRSGVNSYKVTDYYSHSFVFKSQLWHKIGCSLILDRDLDYPLRQSLQPIPLEDLI